MKGYNPLNGTSPQQTLFIKRVLNKVKAAISGMQEKLTAGDGITISAENVISCKKATNSELGISRGGSYGVFLSGSDGILRVDRARETDFGETLNQYKPVVPYNFNLALLSKAGLKSETPISSADEEAVYAFLALTNKILPAFPETSGTYDLVLDTTGSVPVLSWVAQGG